MKNKELQNLRENILPYRSCSSTTKTIIPLEELNKIR